MLRTILDAWDWLELLRILYYGTSNFTYVCLGIEM